MFLRNAIDADLPAIKTIYAHQMTSGTGSFELQVPTLEEMARRRAAVLSKRLPYLAAEIDGQAADYAYAIWFRARPAYRFSVENSVDVHPEQRRCGTPQMLLTELLTRFEIAGVGPIRLTCATSSAECGLEGAPNQRFSSANSTQTSICLRVSSRVGQACVLRRDEG